MRTQTLGTRALAEVLHEVCAQRGLSKAEVVRGAQPGAHPATTYRVLDGSTRDPCLSTLAAICRALDVRPQEVLERCGLWQAAPGPAGHAEVRALWASVACLPCAERVRITQVVRTLVEAAQREREQGQAR